MPLINNFTVIEEQNGKGHVTVVMIKDFKPAEGKKHTEKNPLKTF